MNFRKSLKLIFALTLLSLGACNEFETELRVVPRSADAKNLILNSEKGPLELVPGVYPVRVTLSESEGEPSSVIFTDKKKGEIQVTLQLPPTETALHALEPIEVPSEKLGQPVNLTVIRETAASQDRINISLSDPKTGDLVAIAQIFHQTEEPAYEENTGEFLRSYQRVKYSQRGAYIAVDGRTGDSLSNNSARVLLAPWVYSRYQQVEWHIASDELLCSDPRIEEGQTIARWAGLLRGNSVVDYFAFLRGETETQETDPLYFLPKKRHQLRLAYSESGGSASKFIRDFNAGFAAGPASTSNSALFGFTPLGFAFVRSWTLGMSGTAGLMRAYQEARTQAWQSVEPVVEPLFSWTQELPWEKAGVSHSATPARNTEELTRIHEARLSDDDGSNRSSKLTQESAPQELGYNVCALRDQLAPHALADRRSLARSSLVSKESADQGSALDIHRLRLDQLSLYEKQIEAKSCDRQ